MSITSFKHEGRRYVIIPETEYRKLAAPTRRAGKATAKRNGSVRMMTVSKRANRQDRGDVAESKRRLKGEKPIRYEKIARELGL